MVMQIIIAIFLILIGGIVGFTFGYTCGSDRR